MGRGSYTAGDWSKLKKSRSIETASVDQLFKSRAMNPKFNPKYINMREARDSELHPESTPIVIGVDVTGSMGYLSTSIIKNSLNVLMQELYSKEFVKDPQLMFAALGDAIVDKAPLQVTQFESDIRIAEQLMELYLENAGGDLPEDYELLWYFLAKHTETDSMKKRGKKGFCFTIGDAPCHKVLPAKAISRIFGDKVDCDIPIEQLALDASDSYELFHIAIKCKDSSYNEIIPGRVIHIERNEIDFLPQIIVSAMQLVNDEMSEEEILNQWTLAAKGVVKRVLAELVVSSDTIFL